MYIWGVGAPLNAAPDARCGKMPDLLYVAVAGVFFLACMAYVFGCERL
jgi:hypothetical protein